jgi:hypothetical protein
MMRMVLNGIVTSGRITHYVTARFPSARANPSYVSPTHERGLCERLGLISVVGTAVLKPTPDEAPKPADDAV